MSKAIHVYLYKMRKINSYEEYLTYVAELYGNSWKTPNFEELRRTHGMPQSYPCFAERIVETDDANENDYGVSFGSTFRFKFYYTQF